MQGGRAHPKAGSEMAPWVDSFVKGSVGAILERRLPGGAVPKHTG